VENNYDPTGIGMDPIGNLHRLGKSIKLSRAGEVTTQVVSEEVAGETSGADVEGIHASHSLIGGVDHRHPVHSHLIPLAGIKVNKGFQRW